MTSYIFVVIGAVLVNNVVLVRILGLCPFMGVSKKLDAAIGMGAATAFVLTLASGASHLLNLLLLAAGVVTTVPLLLFTAGARLIPLSTLGFIQYLGPSIMFLLALFYYGEPVQGAKLLTFGFIWSALALFSWDSWRRSRRNNAA